MQGILPYSVQLLQSLQVIRWRGASTWPRRKRGGYVDPPHAGLLASVMSTTGMRTVLEILVALWSTEYDQIGSRDVNLPAYT